MTKKIVFAFVAVTVATLAAQDATRFVVPRTPWGDPDLQGRWPGTAMMGVPMERPLAGGARGGRGPGPGIGIGPPGHWGERGTPQQQASLVVDPPDGRIPPMSDEGTRRTASLPKTWYYDNDGGGPFAAPTDLSAYDRCITRGVVGSMLPVGYNAGNEIVQGPGVVALRNEMIHETRVVPLDGRPHLSPVFRSYMGDTRGRWDGDTLVIDTINLTDKTGVGANGRALFHSSALHLTERLTRTAADRLLYAVTIDDPRTWTRPWTMSFPLTRDESYGMFEYACHEGNYGLRNILSASRAGERP
ncbi:MAG TPA: hypothetical protein VFD69_16805 [Vicinamibacterales bacterium]|nr:hypothetical protein [Vicinamibacterales bacterium]